MKCPTCGNEDTRVTDTRANDSSRFSKEAYVRRRRICEKCGSRFTTVETIAGLTKRSSSVVLRQQATTRKLVVREVRAYLKRFLAETQ